MEATTITNPLNTALAGFFVQIIMTVMTAIFGYICLLVKNYLKKKGIALDTEAAKNNTALLQSLENLKQTIAEQCVLYVQQKFTINERFSNACTFASNKLTALGFTLTQEEVELLIESSLKKLKITTTTTDNWEVPLVVPTECSETLSTSDNNTISDDDLPEIEGKLE
jgi:hypothetical protein